MIYDVMEQYDTSFCSESAPPTLSSLWGKEYVPKAAASQQRIFSEPSLEKNSSAPTIGINREKLHPVSQPSEIYIWIKLLIYIYIHFRYIVIHTSHCMSSSFMNKTAGVLVENAADLAA
jgi:hypothetical protein